MLPPFVLGNNVTTTELGPLFHWSPRSRLPSIKRLGLVPGKRNLGGPTFNWNEDGEEDRRMGEFRHRAVCFGTTPHMAWSYTHHAYRDVGGTFDLWEVYLQDGDEVYVLPQWGPLIREVRIYNRIKKSRLIWVGERTLPAAPD